MKDAGNLAAAGLAVGVGMTAAQCGSSTTNWAPGTGGNFSPVLDPATKVTISIDCPPAANKPVESKQLADDVAAFNKIYPNVTINAKPLTKFDDPAPFRAMRQGHTQTDRFHTYFT